MIPAHLRIQPNQERLTAEQEAEARRFADERIAAQLSTEAIDEAKAEAWLRQAYQEEDLAPPHEIIWLDEPLQLIDWVLFQYRGKRSQAFVDSVTERLTDGVGLRIRGRVLDDLSWGRSWWVVAHE